MKNKALATVKKRLKKFYYLTVNGYRWPKYDNIYYCCTQKTASQWFKAVFSDEIFFQFTGFEVYPFIQLPDKFQNAVFDSALPQGTIGTHLYIDYETYVRIPKPKRYKTFFILRDPRDLVVSWYFSALYSHYPFPRVVENRENLQKLNLEEGLRYSIQTLRNRGLFEGQKSWIKGAKSDKEVKIFKYEDFARNNLEFLNEMFKYLEINMPATRLLTLYERNRFEKFSGGRSPGLEDAASHYRKGIAGDWQQYFNASTLGYFNDVTGDLLKILGYRG